MRPLPVCVPWWPSATALLAALLILLLSAAGLLAEGPEPSPTAAPAASPTPTTPPAATATPAASPAGHNPLGATPQEIVRLYGPILRHNARVRHHQVLEGGTVLDGDLHGRNGLIIRVVYHEGRAILLEFTRVGGAVTPADVNFLLTATADDSAWVPGKDSTATTKLYRRADSKAIASYAVGDDGSLIIAAEGQKRDKFLDNIN